MIKQIYTCDVEGCKEEVQKDELKDIKIEIDIPGSYYRGNAKVTKHICVKCLKERGFRVDDSANRYPEENKNKLQELFMSILEELDVSFNDHDHD